jgi:hypothetical protein
MNDEFKCLRKNIENGNRPIITNTGSVGLYKEQNNH